MNNNNTIHSTGGSNGNPNGNTAFTDTGWKGGKIGRSSKALRFSSSAPCLIAPPLIFTSSAPQSLRSRNTVGYASGAGSMLANVTTNLLTVFRGCEASFQYDRSLNPRRVLTKPSQPVYNNGHDNEKWDYILYVNDIIGEEEGRKFLVLDLLGHGTFGQVAKCQNVKTRELLAVKVIKNQPAYFNQSMMEVTVLELLNNTHDQEDVHHLVRMRDTFIFRNHLCIVVELLSLNLYELIKQNGYRGFSISLIRIFLAQTLDALQVLKDAKIVHCDLKPENILLRSVDSPAIKVIDFGSACHENQTLYTYIQSRFYRSPEVLMGLPYSAAIDMWSLGCIAAELFLGLPVFPGATNYDQVSRIVDTLGLPPVHMLELGKDSRLYFDKNPLDGKFTLKSRDRYSLERGRTEPKPKQYFTTANMHDLVMSYPVRPKDLGPSELEAEMNARRCFLDFLRGLLCYNPVERWSPPQAMLHPFITGRPYTTPFDPLDPATYTASSSNAINTRMRPRSNTLGSLSRGNVPGPMQKIGAAVAENPLPVAHGRPPPEPGAVVGSLDTITLVPDDGIMDYTKLPNAPNASSTTKKAYVSRAVGSEKYPSSLPANVAPIHHHNHQHNHQQQQSQRNRRPSFSSSSNSASGEYISSPLGSAERIPTSSTSSSYNTFGGRRASVSGDAIPQHGQGRRNRSNSQSYMPPIDESHPTPMLIDDDEYDVMQQHGTDGKKKKNAR